MQDFKPEAHAHYPDFRPTLRGCVGRDSRLAASIYTCCSEAFFSISDNIYRSLICRDCDTALSDLFEEIAQKDLERFRILGELFLALGESEKQKASRYPYHKRPSSALCAQDSPALAALWERRRNIDCYETLMGRTEDRVVRSVFSKLLATERLLCRRLESICKT